MKQESRAWFDEAYELSRLYTRLRYEKANSVISFPFPLFKQEYSNNFIKYAFQAKFNETEINEMQDMFKKFRINLPPEEDFLEEKKEVLEELVRDLKKGLDFVGTMVHFGTIIGDIDLGLFCDKEKLGYKQKKFFMKLLKDPRLTLKYPLVDWGCLF